MLFLLEPHALTLLVAHVAVELKLVLGFLALSGGPPRYRLT